MKHTYTKKEALRIIIATAKEYAKMLEGLNYLYTVIGSVTKLNILKQYFFQEIFSI